MISSIDIINRTATKKNADGAVLELREVNINFDNKPSNHGFTLVWVYKDGREFPAERKGQVIFSKEDLYELTYKASGNGWF